MEKQIKVTALSAGKMVPSARFRIGQYISPLADYGIKINWAPAPISKYPPKGTIRRIFWLPLSITSRVPGVISSQRSDVTLLSRELVSTLFTLEGLTKKPRIVDVDDAIWLRRGGGFARKLAECADVVVAGNSTIADWFSGYCNSVRIIPTAVDTRRFTPSPKSDKPQTERVVVGWSGTSANLVYLEEIMPAIALAMKENNKIYFKVTSDRKPAIQSIPKENFEFVKWTPQNEVPFIQSLDIGLMPLVDNDWSRGKCSYKMLLYMSCGVPVIVSPVGMNKEVLLASDVGRGAFDINSWREAIMELSADNNLRFQLGKNGRTQVEHKYSLDALAEQYAGLIKKVANV
jgi:glycosyltransferase involved in cell wall biosynthesis